MNYRKYVKNMSNSITFKNNESHWKYQGHHKTTDMIEKENKKLRL